jgi:hypothetical protein
MCVAAVGPPNVYLSHAWSAPFVETVAAAVSWCKQAGLVPSAVFVWFDAFCLDQWSELPSSLSMDVWKRSSWW